MKDPLWPLPETFPALSGSTLHVWWIDLATPPDPLQVSSTLNGEERARAARLRSDAARSAFEGSHVALREILSAYLRVEASEVEVELGEFGKPHLRSTTTPTPIWFNLTHSDELALVAVSAAGEVGVDTERVKPLRYLERLAERHLAAAELDAWRSVEDDERLDAFYGVWTKKEALLKMIGLGLSRPLERVDSERGTLDGVRYWVRDLDVGGDYRAAIACANAPTEVECYRWERPRTTLGS